MSFHVVPLIFARRAEARRAARLAYSRTAATDDTSPRPALAAADPLTFLRNLSAIVGLIADHAESALPTMFADWPNRAMVAWQTFYRFDATGAPDKRTYRRILESLDIGPMGHAILLTDEWQAAPLVADALDGQIMGETSATSAVPNVLPTTRGHAPAMDGTYRTFRAHMPIVGDGTQRDALELTRDADTLLRMFSHDGELGEYRLLGTQDLAPGNNVPATSDYKPNGALRKATPAAHGTDSHGTPNEYNERGQLIYRGGNGRTETTVGKARHLKPRQYKAPATEDDIRGCFDARTLHTYVTMYDGRKYIGWVGVERTARSMAKPTTTKARQTRARQVESVNAASAPELAAVRAMSLYNAHVSKAPGHTPEPNNHAQIVRTFAMRTPEGVKVSVGLKNGKGYRVTITTSDGKRFSTSTSAPEYVEAIVRNRLALIG